MASLTQPCSQTLCFRVTDSGTGTAQHVVARRGNQQVQVARDRVSEG